MTWFDALSRDQTWAYLWNGRTICGCAAICKIDSPCPVCTSAPCNSDPQIVAVDGREYSVPVALMGAEARYEDWQYLEMMQREWQRPLGEPLRMAHKAPSGRAAIVLIFWSYFETRVDRLLADSLSVIEGGIRADLLKRYASIGARLNTLYRVLFGVTYFQDLVALGHSDVAKLLQLVHERRNEFAHGHPGAIDDEVVERLVAGLADEHEAWIAVYNHRAAAAKRRAASPN